MPSPMPLLVIGPTLIHSDRAKRKNITNEITDVKCILKLAPVTSSSSRRRRSSIDLSIVCL